MGLRVVFAGLTPILFLLTLIATAKDVSAQGSQGPPDCVMVIIDELEVTGDTDPGLAGDPDPYILVTFSGVKAGPDASARNPFTLIHHEVQQQGTAESGVAVGSKIFKKQIFKTDEILLEGEVDIDIQAFDADPGPDDMMASGSTTVRLTSAASTTLTITGSDATIKYTVKKLNGPCEDHQQATAEARVNTTTPGGQFMLYLNGTQATNGTYEVGLWVPADFTTSAFSVAPSSVSSVIIDGSSLYEEALWNIPAGAYSIAVQIDVPSSQPPGVFRIAGTTVTSPLGAPPTNETIQGNHLLVVDSSGSGGPPPASGVPTLSEWGLIILLGGLMAIGVVAIRRKR